MTLVQRLSFLNGACANLLDSFQSSSTVEIHLFGDPMQYESGKGERGLKQWAKAVSVTAQKVGLDTFIFQTIMRVADRLLLSRASDIVQRQNRNQQLAVEEPTENEENKGVKKRKWPHFRYYRAKIGWFL